MKTLNHSVLISLLGLLPACGGQLVEFSKTDAEKSDVRTTDTVTNDGEELDAGTADVGSRDGVSIEAAAAGDVNADAKAPDADRHDNAVADGAIIDSEIPDASITDVATTDTSNLDGSRFESGALIDATIVDSATPDIAGMETAATDLGNTEGGQVGPAILISLGLAKPFAIAATAGITNTITAPITHIYGDVVLTPDQTCNAVTVDNAGGFGLCAGMPPNINGTVITHLYPDTTTATAIKADLNAAFLSLTPPAGPPAVGSLGGGTAIPAPTTLGNVTGSPLVLGDNWFTPGVYTAITSILVTGDVTLDGQGDASAVFVFQSASSLTTADGAPSPGAHARILLTNGTKASNVWWQVASSATLGSYSEFQGSILAAFDITMKTGSTSCGRSMAGAWVGGAGAYIFDSNVVSVPGNGCPL